VPKNLDIDKLQSITKTVSVENGVILLNRNNPIHQEWYEEEGEVQLLELSKGAYKYYKNNVKGNENITYDMARRKLTRNVLLAKKVEPELNGKKLYIYGCLHILVVNNKIVWIKNHPGKSTSRFKKNMELYNRLNQELGIPDDRINARKLRDALGCSGAFGRTLVDLHYQGR
jgi:hypothetical protein